MASVDDIVSQQVNQYLSTATGSGANQKGAAIRNIMQSGLSSADVNKAVQAFTSSIKTAGMREPASASYDKAIDTYSQTGSKGKAIAEIMNSDLGVMDRTAALNQLNSQILLQDYANRESGLERAESNPNTIKDYALLNQARTETGLFGPNIDQRIAQAQQIVNRPRITGGLLSSAGGVGDITAEMIDMPALDSTTILEDTASYPSSLIQQLYMDELGRSLGSKDADTGALEYWSSRLASGITPEQLRAEIENSPEGTVFDAYTGLFNRAPDPEGAQYWQNQLATGALTADQLEQAFVSSPEFTQVINERKTTNPVQLLNNVKETQNTSDLGTFFYQNRKAGVKLPADLMQSIVETIIPDDRNAYEYFIQSQAYAEGLEAFDSAVAQGDTNKIIELQEALHNEDTYYQYYLNNIAKDDNQHHRNLRKETLTGPVFGIDDPKGGLKGSLERGIVRLGDAIGDVVDNPYVQAAVSFAYPPAGAVLNAYATLDSGDNLSPAQVAAAIAGAADLAKIELAGGSLISQLPESVQKFVQSVQDFADGATGRAVIALKQAFPNVDTEKLAGYEDSFKEFLAGGEDVIRDVVGDENIETISRNIAGLEDTIRAIAESTGETYQEVSNRLAGVEDFIRENIGDDNIEAISSKFASFEDLLRGQFGSQQNQIDQLVAMLSQERGPSFTPQRGYQPGLAVNTEFGGNERSVVLDILNA